MSHSVLTPTPALSAAASRRPVRRIAFAQQLAAADCGAACLAMVLGYHGQHRRVPELARRIGAGNDGTSAGRLIDVAGELGLRGTALRLSADAIDALESAAILHWEGNHFVVFERCDARSVTLLDPARGRRRLSRAQFEAGFTGLALKLTPTETFRRGRVGAGTWRPIFGALAEHRGRIAAVASISVVAATFGAALPVAVRFAIDELPRLAGAGLEAQLLVGATMLSLAYFAVVLTRALLLARLVVGVDRLLSGDFMERLVHVPMSFLRQRSRGDLLRRLSSNGAIRSVLTGGALSTALDGTFALTYLIAMFVVSPSLGVVVFGLVAAHAVALAAVSPRARRLAAEQLVNESILAGREIELLSGLELLKATCAESIALSRWSEAFETTLAATHRRERFGGVSSAVLGTLRFASPLVLMAVGAQLVVDGGLSIGTMFALMTLAMAFFTHIMALSTVLLALPGLSGMLERVEDVRQAPVAKAGECRVALRGAVRMQGVHFRYDATAEPILRGAELSIAPGEMIAVVGVTGAGKSTVLRLLTGLEQPERGQVCLDDVSLTQIDRDHLRGQVGVVTQESCIFGDTIGEAIAALQPRMDEQATEAAARAAGLHDEIMAMPMGYRTRLIDGGRRLSGGQRRRLTLARALLGGPALLVIDEATSGLDGPTANRISRTIAELSATRVVITHRLADVRRADRIAVLAEGRFVEVGTHDELVARSGHYAAMVAAQNPGGTDVG